MKMENKILNNSVEKWLSARNIKDKQCENLADIVCDVRDVAFRIIFKKIDYFEDIIACLDKNIGSCTSKHFLLGYILNNAGFDVEYVSQLFHWKDIEIDYPETLKKLLNKISPTYHLYISTCIENKAKELDITWDKGLEKSGLPINYLDGNLDKTKKAIVPLSEKRYENPQEYIKFINSKRTDEPIKRIFYSGLNAWFDQLRISNKYK